MLTANDATVSGHSYDDRTGVSYEFPAAYRRLVVPGEQFVYYKGRTAASGARQPQVYFGTGVVGAVHDAGGGRLRCEILDYLPFESDLPFRKPDGTYYEPAPEQSGYYWVRGVRQISDEVYGAIARAARPQQTAGADHEKAAGNAVHGRDPELQRRVEEYAVGVAAARMVERFPRHQVREQARNNPGFDLLVGDDEHYCEVKGTQQPFPAFFMSEGERAFGEAHSSRYTMVVVYDIDLDQCTHRIAEHRGAPTAEAVALKPAQWSGRLTLGSDSGAHPPS